MLEPNHPLIACTMVFVLISIIIDARYKGARNMSHGGALFAALAAIFLVFSFIFHE